MEVGGGGGGGGGSSSSGGGGGGTISRVVVPLDRYLASFTTVRPMRASVRVRAEANNLRISRHSPSLKLINIVRRVAGALKLKKGSDNRKPASMAKAIAICTYQYN